MFEKVRATPPMKRTTVSITEQRRIKLERLAIEATMKTGKTVKWTDIVNHLIDHYAEEAKKDISG